MSNKKTIELWFNTKIIEKYKAEINIEGKTLQQIFYEFISSCSLVEEKDTFPENSKFEDHEEEIKKQIEKQMK